MKKLALLLLLLAPLAFGQTGSPTVYPPEGTTFGADTTGLGTYNLCIETGLTATTTGTSQETLATCTIPADAFTTGGFAGFEIQASYSGASNTNSKTAITTVGGNSLHSRNSTTTDELWSLWAICLVKDSDTVQCDGRQTVPAGTTSGNIYAVDIDLTFSGTIDVDFDGTTATQAGDITLTAYRVAMISASGSATGLGSAAISWPLLAPDGSQLAPSYANSTEPTAGMWFTGGNTVVQAKVASGTDQSAVVGSYLRAGAGTGTGSGGNIGIEVAVPSTTGSTVNSFQDAIFIHGTQGYVQIGGVDALIANYISNWAGVDVKGGVTDGDGGDVLIRGGFGTGAGDPGAISFQTGTTLASGSTQQTQTQRFRIDEAELTIYVPHVILSGVLFANLGSPSDGTIAYCSDCTKATPCAGSGSGALAKRLNGAWDCD